MTRYKSILYGILTIGLCMACSDGNKSAFYSEPNSNSKSASVNSSFSKEYSKTYFDNGNLKSEGWLRNGSKTDWWIEYDYEGNKLSEGHYAEGQRHGFFRFYIDKNTWKEGDFEHGEQVGAWQLYESGKLRQILMNE